MGERIADEQVGGVGAHVGEGGVAGELELSAGAEVGGEEGEAHPQLGGEGVEGGGPGGEGLAGGQVVGGHLGVGEEGVRAS